MPETFFVRAMNTPFGKIIDFFAVFQVLRLKTTKMRLKARDLQFADVSDEKYGTYYIEKDTFKDFRTNRKLKCPEMLEKQNEILVVR